MAAKPVNGSELEVLAATWAVGWAPCSRVAGAVAAGLVCDLGVVEGVEGVDGGESFVSPFVPLLGPLLGGPPLVGGAGSTWFCAGGAGTCWFEMGGAGVGVAGAAGVGVGVTTG